jgi:hypothetical protein
MKKKVNSEKKLALSKQTITKLSANAQMRVLGADGPPQSGDNNCDTKTVDKIIEAAKSILRLCAPPSPLK